MAEEQTNGGAYDVPDIDSVTTPDEATAAINKINAAWLKDDQHPYCNANHPQHQEFLDAVHKLYEAKFMDDVGDHRTGLQRAMQESLEQQAQQQENLAYEAQDLVDELSENFGWGHFDVEKVIKASGPLLPCERDCLSMLLEVEKGQWDSVIRKIDSALMQYPKAPSEAYQYLSELKRMHESGAEHDEKRSYALAVLQHLRDAGRAKAGLKPREPIGDEDE